MDSPIDAKHSCKLLTVKDALTRLPTADGKRFATIFEHGTLLVEIYAPRGSDPQQPHTRDEIYFVAAGSGEYVCGKHAPPSTRQTFFSPLPELLIVSRILLTT